MHVPVTAFLLSLLVLLSPDLTLAPLIAVEPHGSVISQERDLIRTPSRPGPVRPIDLEAGAPTPSVARRSASQTTAAAVPAVVDPTVAAALEAARSYGEAFGITCAAVRDGQVLWSGAAGRYRDGATPIGGDDSLVIGSVMKTFVSAAILQLAEEGRLTLDDTVLSHLPRQSAVTPDITLRQLLDHTSGLADVFNDTTKTGIETQPEHAWGQTELMATLHAPWYRPGEGYAYANTNYYLLGLVIEGISGRSLADELSRRFFGPLGLDTARILTGKRGELLEPAWATIFWASGAMSSSAADLARWGDALYGDQVLTTSSRSAMLATHNAENYGLGVQRIEVPGAAGYGHTGMLKTYTSLLLHLPDQNVTLSLLVNRTHVDLAGMLAARPPGGGPSLLELAGVTVPTQTQIAAPAAGS